MSLTEDSARIDHGGTGRENVLGSELLLSYSTDGLAVESLGSGEGVVVEHQGNLICVVHDSLPAGWQPIGQVVSHAVADERGPSLDANCGVTSQQNLLERERSLVVIG
jgi:hypothetical protein